MLNLISDAWIPVRCADGSSRVIAPWQMACTDVVEPNWPRPDMNIACLEFLIGLVFLTDPPSDIEDWRGRASPDPQRLRERLAVFEPAFNLVGEGPLFLQDLEPLEGDVNPVDLLFIDSAGANSAKNNADLMVHRDRYPTLDLPQAAMALYTFQGFAPAGGAGNRTSMRGGGPLVTLVEPREEDGCGLWELIWANVPDGTPGQVENLPWMRPTMVSDSDAAKRYPPAGVFNGEAFFGMPRRLRLVVDKGTVVGVIQKPRGNNYALWKHPLSPYYRMKLGEEWLPKHPRAGRFGFRNWAGILAAKPGDELSELALCVRDWDQRGGYGSVIVAGWAMDNMKPRDFTLSVQPFVSLDLEAEDRLFQLIEAAEAAAVALRGALEPITAGGEAREAERERFFAETEVQFMGHVDAIKAGQDPSEAWLGDIRAQAMLQFDQLAVPGLDQRDTSAIKRIVDARKFLGMAFAGYGKQGKAIFQALGLEVPVSRKGKAA
ncbi:type I-E CRISPR-associated protein Cse1/CasA [Aestuariicoccus sp. KMU-90]|uniref:Type I-E CRISPR-associated protein Cse1/CasA n=1 Tax=Thetidibacter halocola TaxID=2827239 RepID=A0A8J8BBS9_9RHOB|nr:type I-E CRISPR-associated protein Cse1/CasA [Thetidibacter halocola]MBS0126543.1 type I-E CRISPR-associated protein Cse1/CasA [Thetidibacter halocola]